MSKYDSEKWTLIFLAIFFSIIVVFLFVFDTYYSPKLTILDLQKYKANCKALDNIDKIELETRLRELSDKNEQLARQIDYDAVAIKHAQNQINEFKVKCKNCTYHLSTNFEN